jgi:hypothetical protein
LENIVRIGEGLPTMQDMGLGGLPPFPFRASFILFKFSFNFQLDSSGLMPVQVATILLPQQAKTRMKTTQNDTIKISITF